MRTYFAAACLLLGAAGCSPSPRVELPTGSIAGRDVSVNVIESGIAAIRHLPIEEYVAGTLIAEFAPSEGDVQVVEQMYEVQAILSRTYALANRGRHARDGYDLCATTHCQLYDAARLRTSRWAGAAITAVQQTARTVVWYDADAAHVLFHADCGGHTSAAGAVWGGRDEPYLRALPDDGPAENAHSAWRHEMSQTALLQILNGDPRTRVGDRLDTIEVLDRDAAGRAARIALHGRREAIVRGEDLRDVLTRAFGPRTIRSTRFVVRREGATFTFEGQGFGHGVGLCQVGALARLRAGAKPADVLERYFPGTKVVRVG